MQILRIHIENFGKLHDFDMEFREGLNHINAANGWGKSTLAAFLKAVFYGLEATTRRSLKENERKKLSTKESIKSVIKPNGITASITTKKAIKIQSNVCNSTLVYPEYAHSTQCYPHLYILIYI